MLFDVKSGRMKIAEFRRSWVSMMRKSYYPLRDLFWEATLRCNAYCAFCGSRCGDTVSEELSTEEILAAFRSVAEAYDARQIMINVTGGEPLLRKDLFEVMTACSAMGFSWGMVSNGMLITESVVEKLRSAGMKTISVSLDGLEETHDALRGVQGGFQRAVNGIRLLKKAGALEHLQVTTVVSKKNIGQLDELYAFLRTLGPDSWRVALVDPIGRAEEKDDLLLDAEDVRKYMAFVSSHSDDPRLPTVTSCSHYLGGSDRELGRNRFLCRTGISVASILANGDIYVCPNVPRRAELIQGNVKTDSLPEIWENGFRFFRDAENRRSEECQNCADWGQCRGDSAHTWDYERHEPKFCYRRLFPRGSQGEADMDLKTRLSALKMRYQRLCGLRVSFPEEGGQTVVFTPDAAEELYTLFLWGRAHPMNLSEQLAALVGRRGLDHILVEFVAPAFLERRSSTEAAFSPRSYQSGLEETKAVNLHYSEPYAAAFEGPCRLLGFIHSHPAELELCLSVPDVALHEKLLERGQELTMIVNPQKRSLAAYYGKEMALCPILLLMEEEQIEKWKIN